MMGKANIDHLIDTVGHAKMVIWLISNLLLFELAFKSNILINRICFFVPLAFLFFLYV